METESGALNPQLRLIQQADMKDKVVLVRLDHNVVKKGAIQDPYRIDVTIKTLFAIAEKGGRPILMTHVGRPKDKKTGVIRCREDQSVGPIVAYLERKLPLNITAPELPADPEQGIVAPGEALGPSIEDLKRGRTGMLYLPNTRWFQGEQASGPERERFARWLAGLADLFVNDAFGSWQPHASTYDVAKHLPSYAGYQIQEELRNVGKVLRPRRPFVAVIAGAKVDTKIGPLRALYEQADHIILGGLICNVYLAAKYGVQIAGVSEEEKTQAMALVEMDRKERKILELPYLVESETLDEKAEGRCRTVDAGAMQQGDTFRYILDIAPRSFEGGKAAEVMASARTVFVNAVMGLTPHFFEGTEALYRLIASNTQAHKLFAGGDTLQEMRNLCPGIYLRGLDAPDYYFFTGGGSVLTALEQGDPYQIKPIEILTRP
jgi:phosphoglycerate kinase